MRVVLDTNVLLAAIATHGLCQALVTLVFRDHVVILSEHILGEVAKHYRGKFKATKRQADAAVAMLRANGELVEPVTVPLAEVRLESLESRVCPGLFLAGEVLDVDGRIGGFNFQWAWASGFVAGTAAAREALTT